jgi:hypothetical protein
VSTRSKFFQLEEAEGGYIAGCSLCYWVDSFTSKRTARSQYLDHDCQRELPLLPTHAVDGWWHRAACVGMNIDIFYEPDTINDAIVVCNTCPVRSSCLFDAMREERSHLAWGVRGGLTPEERMALKVTSRG